MRLGGRGTVGRKVSVWKGTLNILEPNYNLGRHEFFIRNKASVGWLDYRRFRKIDHKEALFIEQSYLHIKIMESSHPLGYLHIKTTRKLSCFFLFIFILLSSSKGIMSS